VSAGCIAAAKKWLARNGYAITDGCEYSLSAITMRDLFSRARVDLKHECRPAAAFAPPRKRPAPEAPILVRVVRQPVKHAQLAAKLDEAKGRIEEAAMALQRLAAEEDPRVPLLQKELGDLRAANKALGEQIVKERKLSSDLRIDKANAETGASVADLSEKKAKRDLADLTLEVKALADENERCRTELVRAKGEAKRLAQQLARSEAEFMAEYERKRARDKLEKATRLLESTMAEETTHGE